MRKCYLWWETAAGDTEVSGLTVPPLISASNWAHVSCVGRLLTDAKLPGNEKVNVAEKE